MPFPFILQMGFPFAYQAFMAQLKQRKNHNFGRSTEIYNEAWLLGGDFRVIQWTKEKSKYRQREMHLFNEFIHRESLVDIFLSNGLYTWTDLRDSHSYAH